MSKYADIFRSYMEQKGTSCDAVDDHALVITYKGKNMNRVTVGVIFHDDDDDDTVSVRCINIITLKGKEQEAYQICNKLNRSRRWAKFSCQEDGAIICSADALISEETVCAITFDIISTVANLVDSTYPEFARARWS